METITGVTLTGKKLEIMEFLHQKVFDPALQSPYSSKAIKAGVLQTILRMEQLSSADAMIRFFWSALHGTDRSIRFADMMAEVGLTRFEEVLEDFRRRFPI